ncbi:hypothetical protein H7142_02840 [Candidatus Saccharibacteria bacterium]|nr:hypothetical protein [Candidatus Saccharibacteria bacterium]
MPHAVTSFHPNEVHQLLDEVKNGNDDKAERFMQIQAIREMRAAVGSLAWLAAHLETGVTTHQEQPVALWGRHHASSLPDMYDRLGVQPIDITVLGGNDHAIIDPHAHTWSDEQIQTAFEGVYRHASNYFKTKSAVLDKRS